MARVIFVLGGPGSGKGTQCAKLVEDFKYVHLSAGDLLRAERARPGSKVGEEIEMHIANGTIVPFAITIGLLKDAMGGRETTFLIDGFPRAMDQALEFEKQVMKPSNILFYDCPPEVLEKRLLARGAVSGRIDDNAAAIKKRFKTFQETSMPVIEHYGDKVSKIDSSKGVEQVYEDTLVALTLKAPKKTEPTVAEGGK